MFGTHSRRELFRMLFGSGLYGLWRLCGGAPKLPAEPPVGLVEGARHFEHYDISPACYTTCVYDIHRLPASEVARQLPFSFSYEYDPPGRLRSVITETFSYAPVPPDGNGRPKP
ncbi:MAG TPA: hypothetical protein VFA18_23935 [Gemmataceae bacterium]|nr:hypothetical protein [Gemmataceae bacterium]